MIILTCKYCGNVDLRPYKTYPEAYCTECERILQLWEMLAAPFNYTCAMIQPKQSERTAPNLMQGGV